MKNALRALLATLVVALTLSGAHADMIPGSGGPGSAGPAGPTGPSGPTGPAGPGVSGLSTNVVPKATSATTLGDSSITDSGTLVSTTNNFSVTTKALSMSAPNETGTGTTASRLVKFNGSGEAIITAAAETAGIVGVCVANCGTSGSATVAVMGASSCVFDNATTAGHYVGVSSSAAGGCTDLGSATFPAGGTTVIGIVTETGIAGTRALYLNTPDVASAASGGGGGGNKNPAGAAGNVQYRATNSNFAAEAAFTYSASADTLSVPSVIEALASKTGDYTLADNDNTILCDATSGVVTITTPAASGRTGKVYTVKKTDSSANSCTIDPNGAETIDGASTATNTAQYQSITFTTNGTNWFIK